MHRLTHYRWELTVLHGGLRGPRRRGRPMYRLIRSTWQKCVHGHTRRTIAASQIDSVNSIYVPSRIYIRINWNFLITKTNNRGTLSSMTERLDLSYMANL